MVATKGLHRGIGGAQSDEVASGPNQTLPGPNETFRPAIASGFLELRYIRPD
jgi:hypothetical protein